MTTPAANSTLWPEYLKALRQEVVPALGCTEPVSLALAAAIATRELGRPAERIDARVSANLMKNGMGVTVPGTGTVGLTIAAAVGAIGGDPDGRLQVLKGLTEAQVANAKAMIAAGRVTLGVADVPNILYAEAVVHAGGDSARVCIADAHTHVVRIERNGQLLFAAAEEDAADETPYDLQGASTRDVFEFALRVPLEQVDFLLEAAELNDALSQVGMSGDYGLHIGATLKRQSLAGLMPEGLMTEIMTRTTAASDARMGGATLPAMSNSGSGNQGIAATMPVVVVAEHVGATREQLLRALALSHLMAVYIHSRLPKLSALCAVTTAAMGAAAGMAYLLDGGDAAVNMAISSMIGDLAGMICDGASNSCAMKVSTSVTAAWKAVLMALDGTRVTGNEGIVAEDVDNSIRNLGELACQGMQQTDAQILHIMMHKRASA
ncbi:MAG: serine dehydratase subunit alpha family protein [Paludibacterium sp.]|uniref:L-cysteine desulfidase family protein n=1 Tax=Paludibacterium sp. TaxID=1917523 RepID=UPI0025F3E667|nr:L-serine ammonia-lyase, iron-sulfur-dependent, subunit alpha [Paludibacterium sp.]MBV8046232.1 serine dehydratase subunit alpha family protein [Paludibacterium sp.]MBV8649448.1 serine dehydratase subunit alpha family protein [Paludibacterium sp.]